MGGVYIQQVCEESNGLRVSVSAGAFVSCSSVVFSSEEIQVVSSSWFYLDSAGLLVCRFRNFFSSAFSALLLSSPSASLKSRGRESFLEPLSLSSPSSSSRLGSLFSAAA